MVEYVDLKREFHPLRFHRQACRLLFEHTPTIGALLDNATRP